jgi:SP family general alpha glucoside:H+ symporter-like MFS transporter
MEKQDSPSVNQVELETTLTEVAKVATIHDPKLQQAALEGTADEHELTIRGAIRAYPPAIMWALVSSTCVIMEGYDTNLLSNFFAYRKCTLGSEDISRLLTKKLQLRF